MKLLLKSLFLSLFLTSSAIKAEGEIASVVVESVIASPSALSTLLGSSQDAAYIVFQAAANNPQMVKLAIGLAAGGFGGYKLYRSVYNSVLMKAFKDLKDEVANLKRQLKDKCSEIISVITNAIKGQSVTMADSFQKQRTYFSNKFKAFDVNLDQRFTVVAQEFGATNATIAKVVTKQEETNARLDTLHGNVETVDKKVELVHEVASQVAGGQQKIVEQVVMLQDTVDQGASLNKDIHTTVTKTAAEIFVLKQQNDELLQRLTRIEEGFKAAHNEAQDDDLQKRFAQIQLPNGEKNPQKKPEKIAVAEQITQESLRATISVAVREQFQQHQSQQRQQFIPAPQKTANMTESQLVSAFNQALSQREEERCCDVILSVASEVPALMQRMHAMQKQMYDMQKHMLVAQQLNCAMFHDLCYIAQNSKETTRKYQSLLVQSFRDFKPTFSLPTTDKKGRLLLDNGEALL